MSRILPTAVLVALLAAGPATAQVAYGPIFAAVDEAVERQCLAGKPAHPIAARRMQKAATKLLERYVKAAAAGDSAELAKLFPKHGATWLSAQGVGDPRRLTDPFLAGARPEQISVEQTAFVVGGDTMSGRGVFILAVNDGATVRRAEYGIDFQWDEWWPKAYILHVSVFGEPGTAPKPRPYCHLSLSQTY